MIGQVYPVKKKAYIKNLTLIIAAFCTAFFPRIINAAGAPAIINFLHLGVVPFTFLVALTTTTTKERRQIATSWELILGFLILLVVITASTLLNQAGLINLFLDFGLLTEPFMMLLAIVCIPLSTASCEKLKIWLLGSALINLFLAFAQEIFIDVGLLAVTRMSKTDNIQGVFYLSGAGNYVSAAISIAVAIYYLLTAKKVSIWIRVFWLLMAFYQLLLSDSKQILIVFVIAWVVLLFTKYSNLRKALMYLIAIILFIAGFYWCMQNLDIEGLSAFKYWFNRTELYGPDGEAVNAKMAGIRIILSYFKSHLNWWFGLGPGHTIGRLGGWILRDYSFLLAPLKPTIHPATQEIWNAMNSNWLVLESSMFSPIFSWVGIWGDLGFLGLGAYLYLGYIVWNRLCQDDFSKWLMLTMLVFGFIFTQMEEPGQSLTIAVLIGLQWHERQNNKRSRHHPAHLVTDAYHKSQIS